MPNWNQFARYVCFPLKLQVQCQAQPHIITLISEKRRLLEIKVEFEFEIESRDRNRNRNRSGGTKNEPHASVAVGELPETKQNMLKIQIEIEIGIEIALPKSAEFMHM